MTHSVSEQRTIIARPYDFYLARLAATAIALALVDNSIPSPLPGVKLGISNIIVLIAYYKLGWRAAVSVAMLRIMAVSLLMGSLLSPGFFLSLGGCLFSLVGLGVAGKFSHSWFGIISLSLIAAFTHLAGQVVVVRLVFIPTNNVFYFLPALMIASLVTGLVNGVAAVKLFQFIEKETHIDLK